ncbi:aspartoacylase [Leptolyngbya sp. CCNP1308]|uniref:aspartoacylase n=1 Tax=Leptolyngbya sp. CCNP1308 TaxID=3110255 RepID=UPI002B1EDE2F|nr:aspartoacylase [Leptolyngbya sp. CCNP1308]MEA5451169.1 aspartoacylase [Leptolyngbya sp. CCNP1308]
MGKINRVLIAGGTHGNELTGVYAVKKFERSPDLVRRSSFETVTLLGNPRAIAANCRYIDQDLNRSFNTGAAIAPAGYEVQRSEHLRQRFGPAGQTPVDFVIDLHSTTSNAGVMIILDSLDGFTLGLAAYLSQANPEIKLYSSEGSGRRQDSLRSLAPHRIGIEVGPLAHGTLSAQLFQKTEAVVQTTLDYLERYNLGTAAAEPPTALTLYQYVDALDYPRDDEGNILAMIHPQRQWQDYVPLESGDPLFLTFEEAVIPYAGNARMYPVFINEAAYYEKGIALCLTEKRVYQLE